MVFNTEPDQDFAIDGQPPTFNNVQVDGGEQIVNYWTTLGQRIPLEGVQEINVITNGFRPEYGRLGGGLINVATRPGGNNWRGSLFEFYRGDALNSNSFEANALGIEKATWSATISVSRSGGPSSMTSSTSSTAPRASKCAAARTASRWSRTPLCWRFAGCLVGGDCGLLRRLPARAGDATVRPPLRSRIRWLCSEDPSFAGDQPICDVRERCRVGTPAFDLVFFNVPTRHRRGAAAGHRVGCRKDGLDHI